MLSIAVVDDEAAVTGEIAALIGEFGKANNKNFEVKTYRDGMDIISVNEFPDIIFLDIEMKNLDGMRAAREIRKRDEYCVIIFVTRMAQYAIEGYEVSALDFIVKPVTRETFFYKFARAVEAAEKHGQKVISITSNGGKRKVFISDINYVEVVNHKVLYHLNSGVIEVWDSLKSVCEKLEPYGFALCNSCYLVNMSKVKSFEGGYVQICDEQLKISRQKREKFLKKLAEFFG